MADIRLFSKENQEKISKYASKRATEFLHKLLPEKYEKETKQQFNLEIIFARYRKQIPPVIKSLDSSREEISSLLDANVDNSRALYIVKKAQTTMLKAYGIIFSLGTVVTEQKGIYNLVFSKGSLGGAEDVRVAELSMEEMFKYTSLTIGNVTKEGKVKMGIGLANLTELEMLRTSMMQREQTEEEVTFGTTMYALKKQNKKEKYARVAEVAAAQKYGADISNATILRDTEAARTMSDVRQYFSDPSQGPRVEVKHFGEYYDWREREKKAGTASLVNFVSLKNDLLSISLILSKRHKLDDEQRKQYLKKHIYEKGSFITEKCYNQMKNDLRGI